MIDRQAITLDWWEGHFRLQNPLLFSQDQKQTALGTDEERINSMSNSYKNNPSRNKSGRDKLVVGKTVFKRLGKGGLFFNDRYAIWQNGHKIGVCLANSANEKATELNDVQIKIENNILYENSWIERLQQTAEDMEATFHNFTRLDIAVDGGDFFTPHKRMLKGELLLLGRASVNDYYIRKKGSPNRVINGFYIGSRSSTKYFKCYNKTNELTRSNKTYISKFWNENNIDTSKDVQRLELTLRNDECKKYKIVNEETQETESEIDWTRLNNTTHLASIFKSSMRKFAEYRIKGAGKNISRMEQVELINWDDLGGITLEKNSTIASTEIWRAKLTCKYLFEISHITDATDYFDIAYEIAINNDIVEWFTKMQPYWIKDLEYKAKSKDGDLSQLPYKFHFKRYNAGDKILLFEP